MTSERIEKTPVLHGPSPEEFMIGIDSGISIDSIYILSDCFFFNFHTFLVTIFLFTLLG